MSYSLLNFSRHIKEHLKKQVDVRKMTLNKNLEIFHYFRMHDLNKDGKIDGLEIIKGVTHLHDDEQKIVSEAHLEAIVSSTLRKLDTDDDGYITYAEFKKVGRN
uniref:EF-hand domain-containing protein n=1 Tax=Elaeophora elaphi TaxID=1147741 RepID=A0A0R3RN67_9BILA